MHVAIGSATIASVVPLFVSTSKDVRIVAFAFLWFLCSVAPVVCFNNRLYFYYDYEGTAALSVGFGALARLAVTSYGMFFKAARYATVTMRYAQRRSGVSRPRLWRGCE
jgi:hypothetical protein